MLPAYPSTKAKQRLWVDDLIIRLELLLTDLRTLRAELHNRKPVTLAPPAAQTVTRPVRRAVLAAHRANPSLTQQSLANRFNLNVGRVSEVIAGKRM